jgi:uncharacterized RDD family membrane protein YckC
MAEPSAVAENDRLRQLGARVIVALLYALTYAATYCRVLPLIEATMAGRDDDANPFAAPESDLEPGDFAPASDERIEYANFGQRLVAAFVDNIILRIAGAGIGKVLEAATEAMDLEPLVLVGFALILGISVGWLYEALQESSEAQATLGKRMMGIIVTDMSGQRLSFGQATGRYFAKLLSLATCMIGYIIQPFTEQKQALHDILAKTLVVKA